MSDAADLRAAIDSVLFDALSAYDRARVRAGECSATEAYADAVARQDAQRATMEAAARFDDSGVTVVRVSYDHAEGITIRDVDCFDPDAPHPYVCQPNRSDLADDGWRCLICDEDAADSRHIWTLDDR